MNKNIVILASVAIIVVITSVLFINRGDEQVSPGTESNLPADEATMQEEQTAPEDVVESFMDYFLASAPPEVDEDAVDNAVALMSEGAKMQLGEDFSSSSLAAFMGVQDIPDEGYEIGEVNYVDNEATGEENALAEVEVILDYSGEDAVKTFVLSKTDSGWLIDSVR